MAQRIAKRRRPTNRSTAKQRSDQIMIWTTKLLCLLLLSITVVKAQTPEGGDTEYLNWKKQVSTTLQDYDHLYTFQVAVALKRTDKTHIHILLSVVGRTPNYYFISSTRKCLTVL